MHFINVSATGGPRLKKEDVESYFQTSYFRDDPKSHFFLIREPFNHTYNPAKNFKLLDVKKLTRMFEKGLRITLTDG